MRSSSLIRLGSLADIVGGVEQYNVNAHRDNFSYDVSFESHEMYDPPRPGAHVAVHVGKDSGKSPPSE
jgi:hypothetical protein